MNYAVTHPGQAHRDDFISSCIVFALFSCPVSRREPTPQELEDPEILVFDTGLRYEPDLSNFDHHQLSRDAAPDCALQMLSRHFGLEDGFSIDGWYNATALIDSKGPYAASKALDLPRFPFELLSPVEDLLLEMFQQRTLIQCSHWDPLGELMQKLGQHLIDKYAKLLQDIYALRDVARIEAHELVTLMCFDRLTDPDATGVVRKRYYSDAGILVTRDDRGPGWMLYRYDDHPRVDFTRVDKTKTVFVHANGFIAKTVEMPFTEAVELAKTAISPLP